MLTHDEERRVWFRRQVLPLEPQLRAYALRLAGGRLEDAEDLVHEVFAKLIVYEGWRGVENPAAFANRALKNLALDALRRRKVVPIDTLADLDDLGLTDGLPDPETVTIDRDELRTLAGLIGELPPQCRRVFTLCKVYGLSHADIAVELGLSVNTVEKHVTHGLRFCSERLARRRPAGPAVTIGRPWARRGRNAKR